MAPAKNPQQFPIECSAGIKWITRRDGFPRISDGMAGTRELLRVVNSVKVTSLLSRMFSKERVMRTKERLRLGQTLVVLARKHS